MPNQIIYTPNAPEPIGPYSQAVLANGILYVSGQIPINPANGSLVEGDTKAEATQVMENIKAILEAAGASFNDVIKATIFLSDMALFATVNEVYGSYFTQHFPARETVAVKHLPKYVNVEISVLVNMVP
ncbi:MAG: RidA family protein [Bacteroidetes bacterium]|nr:MAG: RidA family protein [Bacteroidota bacterium]TAE70604.1 MAG: RidA family protein [Bacteroidota bacterium]